MEEDKIRKQMVDELLMSGDFCKYCEEVLRRESFFYQSLLEREKRLKKVV